MKRYRSHGEGSDEGHAGEKGVLRGWGRRDLHFYPKAEFGSVDTKGTSSSSRGRPLTDDREPPWPSSSRKRFDREWEVFDRRWAGGGFDRCRDGGGDRSVRASSSPRFAYSSGRVRPSGSFSLSSRRDYPRGLRSERDRARREGSGGSSWWRSSGGKDAVDEDLKSVASSVDSDAGRGRLLSSEDLGKAKSRDSSNGDRLRSVESRKKHQERRREGCCNREMEEGELEPDLKPEPETIQEVKLMSIMEGRMNAETECRIRSEVSSEFERKFSSKEKLVSDAEETNGKEGGVSVVSDSCKGTEEVPSHEYGSVNLSDKREDHECDKASMTATDVDMEKQVDVELENPGLKSPGDKQDLGKELPAEEEEQKDAPLSEERLEKNEKEERCIDLESKSEVEQKEERCIDLEIDPEEGKDVDLEVDGGTPMALFDSSKQGVAGINSAEVTMKFLTDHNNGDKGKSLAFLLSNEVNSVDKENATEGSSIKGFELIFPSNVTRLWQGKCGVVFAKNNEAKLNLEKLDLSLALPGVSLGHTSQDPTPRPISPCTSQDLKTRPTSPVHARSIESLPALFLTNSDGFTASVSFSDSQPVVYNPSRSLTQSSTENYENSVGSRPIFQRVDQVSNSSIWQGHPSSESKHKGFPVLFHQRSIITGKLPHHSSHLVKAQHSKPDCLSQQISLPTQSSPVHSYNSRDTISEHNKKVFKKERSSSLLGSKQQEAEPIVFNGSGVIERIVTKIVSEPLQMVGRMIQDITEQSIPHLRESIGEIVKNKDKHGPIYALQETLQKRSDLTLETLSTCHRVLLEILVTLKTGLPDFLQRANNIPSSDLAEIFLNLKCRNIACRSTLPVDKCDCKVCAQKDGFCSACMCLVCSKFDLASNTCSWVGCDVCLHWCHTECALRDSHIRNGRSVTGAHRTAEMQFHCVACGHSSEMFGFVKEVFKTYAKDWKSEILAKELEYVKRIFSASEDSRGKRLYDVADRLLTKLEKKASHSEVIIHILGFLAESDSNLSSLPRISPQKEPFKKNTEVTYGLVGSSKEAMWLPTVSAGKSHSENGGCGLPSMDGDQISQQTGARKKQVEDELESVIKLKQEEAKMYQAHADDARREADGLKCIAIAKREKIEKEYASRLAKLRLVESEEKRKQKLEELQSLERVHHDYFNMKVRMQADAKELLLKMEATQRNLKPWYEIEQIY